MDKDKLKALDAAISGLGKRQFLLHSTREAEPTIFGTRWAMSYLRGPLTRGSVRSYAPPPSSCFRTSCSISTALNSGAGPERARRPSIGISAKAMSASGWRPAP